MSSIAGEHRRTIFTGMAQIDHDTFTVHGINHLTTEVGETIVCVAAACRVADVVVAIVAERDIYNATLGEVAYVSKVVLESQSVFNAEEDRLTSVALILIQVGRRACDTDVVAVLSDDLLELVKDKVSILAGERL